MARRGSSSGQFVAVASDDPLRRLQFRLWQVAVMALTILVTCWCYTLHPAVGLTATFLGKHVLVAVLAAGLHLPPVREEPPRLH